MNKIDCLMNIVILKQLYKDSCIPEMQNSRNRLSGKQWCISPQHIINPSCNPYIFILILTEYWHALKQQKVLTQWETCDDLNVLSLWSPQFYPELHEAQTFFFFWQTQAPDARPWKICICTSGFLADSTSHCAGSFRKAFGLITWWKFPTGWDTW